MQLIIQIFIILFAFAACCVTWYQGERPRIKWKNVLALAIIIWAIDQHEQWLKHASAKELQELQAESPSDESDRP
jgi:hypothetical protein